jgi:hypothetical protein
MNPLAGDHGSSADNRSSGQSPVRDSVRETGQQIRGSVSDLVKNVTDVTRNLTRAATGRGANGQGDNGASSQGDNDDSGE